MWQSRKVKAFTLLECLVALLVIAGAMTVYQAMTGLTGRQIVAMSDSHQDNWLLFCQQFRKELDGSRFVKLENNRLYVQQGKKDVTFGHFKKGDFRKANASGKGFHPMLYGIVSADFVAEDQTITLNLLFENGLERTFVYAFETGESGRAPLRAPDGGDLHADTTVLPPPSGGSDSPASGTSDPDQGHSHVPTDQELGDQENRDAELQRG